MWLSSGPHGSKACLDGQPCRAACPLLRLPQLGGHRQAFILHSELPPRPCSHAHLSIPIIHIHLPLLHAHLHFHPKSTLLSTSHHRYQLSPRLLIQMSAHSMHTNPQGSVSAHASLPITPHLPTSLPTFHNFPSHITASHPLPT